MKISLTLEEIKALVAEKYSVEGFDLEIVESNSESVDDGWISNIGRNQYYHPETLSPDTHIEAKHRNGHTRVGFAGDWRICWREISGFAGDIVAYRVIK